MFLRTRSCSHFMLTEGSYQISVFFHRSNHLSKWKEICRVPVITTDACVRVRIAFFPRIRIENRERERERGHNGQTPTTPLSKFISYLEKGGSETWWGRGMQVTLISVHLFDLHNTYLLRNAYGHQQNLAHDCIPGDKWWEHLHPNAMPASFMSQNPFMELESMLEVLY